MTTQLTFDAFGELPVTLYHGTRRSLATEILRDGFRPTPVDDQTAAVAATYRIRPAQLRDQLSLNPNFSTSDPERGATVSTTADPYRAARWAERAPEAARDALRAVYLLMHPEDDDRQGNSWAADFWLMAQRVDDPPVTVEVRTRLGAIQCWGHTPGATALKIIERNLSARRSIDDIAEALTETVMGFYSHELNSVSEWRVAVENADAVGASGPLPFRVSFGLLGYLSELPLDQLGRQVQAGAWGPSGREGRPDDDWWPLDRVWSELSSQRRAQFEEFVGRTVCVTQC